MKLSVKAIFQGFYPCMPCSKVFLVENQTQDGVMPSEAAQAMDA